MITYLFAHLSAAKPKCPVTGETKAGFRIDDSNEVS